MFPTYKGSYAGAFVFDFSCNDPSDVVCVVTTDFGELTLSPHLYTVRLNADQEKNSGGEVTLAYVLNEHHYLTIGKRGENVHAPADIQTRIKTDIANVLIGNLEARYEQVTQLIKTEYQEAYNAIMAISPDLENILSRIANAKKEVSAVEQNLEELGGNLTSLQVKEVSGETALQLTPTTSCVYNITLNKPQCAISFASSIGLRAGILKEIRLYLKQGTGANKVTFPSNIKWAGGYPPTLSFEKDYVDIVQLDTIDGGQTWHGAFVDQWVANVSN